MVPPNELDRREEYVSAETCGWLISVAGALEGKMKGYDCTLPFDDWSNAFERSRAEVAMAVAEAQTENPSAREAAATTLERVGRGLPLPHLRALERELRKMAKLPYAPAEISNSARVAILLVREDGTVKRGVPASLEIELLRGGSGQVFPHPAMLFVKTDPGWDSALARALQAALADHNRKWPDGEPCDAQWRVRLPEGGYFSLTGGSAGAAARYALELAFGAPKQKSSSMLGVAFVAEMGANGALSTVDIPSLPAKLREGMSHSLPSIHTFVLAEAQKASAELSLDLDPREYLNAAKGERMGAKVIFAEDFAGALDSLDKHLRKDWGGILDALYTPEWNRHKQLTDRPSLDRPMIEHWKKVMQLPDGSGGWGLMANAFFGKSAFSSCWFRAGRPVHEDFFVAGHFFRERSELSNVRAALKSIALQLCQAHDIPVPANERPEREFVKLLTEAGARARTKGRTQMIVLDGLDEADAAERSLLEEALGAPHTALPPGVFLVATMRPGGDLARFGDIPGFKIARLDPLGRTTTEEIRGILQSLAGTLPERIEDDLLDRLAAACGGLLGLAFHFTVRKDHDRLRADLAEWRENPSSIPRGLAAVMRDEWTRAIETCRKTLGGVTRSEQKKAEHQARSLIGCLALTGDITQGELCALVGAIPAAAWCDRLEKGDLSPRHLPEVLDAARILFDPVPQDLDESATRLRFWHTSFPQFIRGDFKDKDRGNKQRFLDREERGALHRVLAYSSLALWEHPDRGAAAYALRAVCTHLRGAGMGVEWNRLLMETPEFLFQRGETGGMSALAEDFPQLGEESNLGLSEAQAKAIDAVREVIRARGHFVETE
jgi:hypothetical protein